MLVFFYDILVYSKISEEHLEHLEIVLVVLWMVNYMLILHGRLEYLRHIISSEGVEANPNKI